MREIRGHSRKGRLFERWKDKVKEYMYERGADREGEGLEQAKKSVFDSSL